jgi:hypothetical protein
MTDDARLEVAIEEPILRQEGTFDRLLRSLRLLTATTAASLIEAKTDEIVKVAVGGSEGVLDGRVLFSVSAANLNDNRFIFGIRIEICDPDDRYRGLVETAAYLAAEETERGRVASGDKTAGEYRIIIVPIPSES